MQTFARTKQPLNGLAAIRNQRHLSLRDVERLTGVSHSNVRNLEMGTVRPSLITLRALCAGLEATPEQLIGGEE